MVNVKKEDGVDDEKQTKFKSEVGKLLHLMRWSRPDIRNIVRECSRRMTACNKNHMKSMLRCMKYCIDIKHRGWTIKPDRKWNGKDQDIEI